MRSSTFDSISSELARTRSELAQQSQQLMTLERMLPAITINTIHSALACSNTGTETTFNPPISQIYLSGDSTPPGALLQLCMSSVRNCFPGCCHTLYDNRMIVDFLSTHYGSQVVETYHRLRPYAYKADLARLCILKIVGGWYFDLGITMVKPLRIPSRITLFTARERQTPCLTSWACNNSIIYATPGHPVIDAAIELVLSNCSRDHYGSTPLCPTGPNAWGRAVAMHAEPDKTLFGDMVELTPTHWKKNRACLAPDGDILCFLKPSEGGDGFAVFGEKHLDNYNHYWNSRTVYKP